MKRREPISLFEKFVITLVLFFLSTTAFAIQGYEAIDLGTLDGKYTSVGASAISENGQVAGTGIWWDSSGVTHRQGFIWDKANGMRELEGIGEFNVGIGDINDFGQVVGAIDYSSGNRHAFLWENGVFYDLGSGSANAINNSGVVVGRSPAGAFMWDKTNGRYNPFGQGDIRPSEINENGEVVGSTRNSQGYLQGFIWDEINGLKLIDMPTDIQSSVGIDINNFSQITGDGTSRYYPHYNHSYIWERTNVISGLGNLGGNREWASGINDKGQIVGHATVLGGGRFARGFIWDEINGMKNINEFINTIQGFQYIAGCIDVNNSGQIIASGMIDEVKDISHAFILNPIPDEPSINAIMAFFDESVANGTLEGDGPGNSAENRLNALRNMLEMAGDLISIDDIEGACSQLKSALDKCDGMSPPPDFVAGPAVSELHDIILELIAELGCE